MNLLRSLTMSHSGTVTEQEQTENCTTQDHNFSVQQTNSSSKVIQRGAGLARGVTHERRSCEKTVPVQKVDNTDKSTALKISDNTYPVPVEGKDNCSN